MLRVRRFLYARVFCTYFRTIVYVCAMFKNWTQNNNLCYSLLLHEIYVVGNYDMYLLKFEINVSIMMQIVDMPPLKSSLTLYSFDYSKACVITWQGLYMTHPSSCVGILQSYSLYQISIITYMHCKGTFRDMRNAYTFYSYKIRTLLLKRSLWLYYTYRT